MDLNNGSKLKFVSAEKGSSCKIGGTTDGSRAKVRSYT